MVQWLWVWLAVECLWFCVFVLFVCLFVLIGRAVSLSKSICSPLLICFHLHTFRSSLLLYSSSSSSYTGFLFLFFHFTPFFVSSISCIRGWFTVFGIDESSGFKIGRHRRKRIHVTYASIVSYISHHPQFLRILAPWPLFIFGARLETSFKSTYTVCRSEPRCLLTFIPPLTHLTSICCVLLLRVLRRLKGVRTVTKTVFNTLVHRRVHCVRVCALLLYPL